MSNTEYVIPLKFRKMENLHILFWLLKDISWCMIWRPMGIAMIFPTLIIAIVITWRNRKNVSELCHNAAIVIWITANSYWMISEFLHFDTQVLLGTHSFKDLALIPFAAGILILAYYYLWYGPRYEQNTESI